jgi:hypothetical protein
MMSAPGQGALPYRGRWSHATKHDKPPQFPRLDALQSDKIPPGGKYVFDAGDGFDRPVHPHA